MKRIQVNTHTRAGSKSPTPGITRRKHSKLLRFETEAAHYYIEDIWICMCDVYRLEEVLSRLVRRTTAFFSSLNDPNAGGSRNVCSTRLNTRVGIPETRSFRPNKWPTVRKNDPSAEDRRLRHAKAAWRSICVPSLLTRERGWATPR